MANAFKYPEFLKKIANCPPSLCKEMNTNAFRFIFEDKSHPNNFLPVLLINPLRRLDNDEMKCSGYALSFFDTIKNATTTYSNLYKRNKNIGNNLGNHVAEVSVEANDGVATEASATGHFDFFEYKATDFYKKIVKIEKLKI